MILKSSQNKKDLNDVTADPFLVFFCCCQMKKDTKNGAAVTSLRSNFGHSFRDILGTNFSTILETIFGMIW